MPIIGETSWDLNVAVTGNLDAAVAADVSLRLTGYASRKIGGGASFNIIHGPIAATGEKVIPVEIAPVGSSESFWLGPEGLPFPDGISVEHLSGEFDVALFYKRLT